MSLKEIAFIANWARNNFDVVKLIAANTKWHESGIREILDDLETKISECLESEIIVSKHLSEMNNEDGITSVPVPYKTNKKNIKLIQKAYGYSK